MILKTSTHQTAGYTIIETMIAVSLFLIIVVFGTSALVNANIIYQKSHSMRSIMDNLNFVMEDMARNIRTGYNYRCYFNVNGTIDPNAVEVPRSCASGWALAFESQEGTPGVTSDQWVYRIWQGKLFKSTNGTASMIQLTPDEIFIDSTSGVFSVLGAEASPGNTQQPLVTIRLVGSITQKGVVTPFSLQTSSSQRLIDI